MTDLVQNPVKQLNEVNQAFRIAMRRLYRTRNIVLHGGATQGVALDASLRTTAPLLGAGLDRIVHASYTEGLDPLDLAARAEVALQLVGGETGLATVDLTETSCSLVSSPVSSDSADSLGTACRGASTGVRWAR
ncbi:hypothetical protein [Streptomyces cinereoruber]|uniref:hypothetical protein n=1 Tax=Streptomyces cinereoruber TaxID=67260 RepID=UPI0036319E64